MKSLPLSLSLAAFLLAREHCLWFYKSRFTVGPFTAPYWMGGSAPKTLGIGQFSKCLACSRPAALAPQKLETPRKRGGQQNWI